MGRLFWKELARPIADYWKPRAVISQNEKPAREVLELVEGLPSVPTPDLLPSGLRCAKTLAKVLTDDEVPGGAVIAEASASSPSCSTASSTVSPRSTPIRSERRERQEHRVGGDQKHHPDPHAPGGRDDD